MGSEILALKGRLAQAKEKKRNLEASAAMQVRAAREVLDPFQRPISKLKDEQAMAAVGMLQSILSSLRAEEALIAELEEALGQ